MTSASRVHSCIFWRRRCHSGSLEQVTRRVVWRFCSVFIECSSKPNVLPSHCGEGATVDSLQMSSYHQTRPESRLGRGRLPQGCWAHDGLPNPSIHARKARMRTAMMPIIPAQVVMSMAASAGFTRSSPDSSRHLRVAQADINAGIKKRIPSGTRKRTKAKNDLANNGRKKGSG